MKMGPRLSIQILHLEILQVQSLILKIATYGATKQHHSTLTC